MNRTTCSDFGYLPMHETSICESFTLIYFSRLKIEIVVSWTVRASSKVYNLFKYLSFIFVFKFKLSLFQLFLHICLQFYDTNLQVALVIIRPISALQFKLNNRFSSTGCRALFGLLFDCFVRIACSNGRLLMFRFDTNTVWFAHFKTRKCKSVLCSTPSPSLPTPPHPSP